MLVKVIYFAEFQRITGKDIEEFELKNNEIKELLNLLLKKYSSMKALLWSNRTESINSNVSVIVNNNPIHSPNVLFTSLREGDEVIFLLPISGG